MKIIKLGQKENKSTFSELTIGTFFKDEGRIFVKLDDIIEKNGEWFNTYEITTNTFYKFYADQPIKKINSQTYILFYLLKG